MHNIISCIAHGIIPVTPATMEDLVPKDLLILQPHLSVNNSTDLSQDGNTNQPWSVEQLSKDIIIEICDDDSSPVVLTRLGKVNCQGLNYRGLTGSCMQLCIKYNKNPVQHPRLVECTVAQPQLPIMYTRGNHMGNALVD